MCTALRYTTVIMGQYEFFNTQIFNNYLTEEQSFGLFCITSPNAGHEWHYHNEYQIIYMKESIGTFFIGNDVFPYNNGTMVFLGKNLPHAFYHDHDFMGDELSVNIPILFFNENCLGERFFKLPEMERVNKFLKMSDRGFRVTGQTRDKIAKILDKVNENKEIERVLNLLEILKILSFSDELQFISAVSQSVDSKVKQHQSERIDKVIRYVYNNFRRRIELAEVAKRVYMTPQAFSTFFKKTTGKTFSGFVNQVRISEVSKLLLTTDRDITSIAFSCGFNNFSNFSRRFREIKNVSPREFRTR